MRGTHWWTGGAALAWLALGCGEAPPPPTAVMPAQRVGAGSKGQTESNVLEVRPSPDSVMQTPPAPPDPGAELEPLPEVEQEPPPPPPAMALPQVTACRETSVAGCDGLYVRFLQTSPDLCVQLSLDNCNENGRVGLGVNVPIKWRLAAGSASSNKACDVREYDPKSQPALAGTGDVTFEQQGREISGLVVDVDLRIAASEREPTLPTEVSVATSEPLGPIELCDD